MILRINSIKLISYTIIVFSIIWILNVYKPSNGKTVGKRNIDIDEIKNELDKIIKNNEGSESQLLHDMKSFKRSLESLSTKYDGKKFLDGSFCQNELSEVPNEIYHGNIDTQQFWYEGAWTLNFSSNVNHKLPDLVTIVTIFKGANLHKFVKNTIEDLNNLYHGIRVIIGNLSSDSANINLGDEKVEIVNSVASESDLWVEILAKVSTKYVFLARDVDIFHAKWMNLERSIRLLNAHGLRVSAVGGATRNSTGHWTTNCFQADIQYFTLIMTPGYKRSACDCMVCSTIWENGPFMAKTKELVLDPSLSPNLMFLDWFLRMQQQNGDSGSVLACPDILYNVRTTTNLEERQHWQDFASKTKFGSVEIRNFKPKRQYSFSCNEVGLECNPLTQASSHLVPWCCLQNYVHIMRTIDDLSKKLNFHYELDSGSLLGAVKLNNFIPWDIDGDMYIPTHFMHLFEIGGIAEKALVEAGIKVYGHKHDNYWDKGAKYFQVFYGGINVEMMGKRGNLTLGKLPHREDLLQPTRILVGDKWIIVHTHPGEYLRGRYGPGYLRHVQAWRFVETMDSAFQYGLEKSPGWKPCIDNHHSCLDRYSEDGNIHLLPHNFF